MKAYNTNVKKTILNTYKLLVMVQYPKFSSDEQKASSKMERQKQERKEREREERLIFSQLNCKGTLYKE